MDRRYYSKAHFDRLSNGRPDTAETIAERKRWNAAREQANREAFEKYPVPTDCTDPVKVQEWSNTFNEFQEKRIKELLAV